MGGTAHCKTLDVERHREPQREKEKKKGCSGRAMDTFVLKSERSS